jgi:hypothetical protein
MNRVVPAPWYLAWISNCSAIAAIAVTLAACSSPVRSHVVSTHVSSPQPCKAQILRGRGGREGEAMGAHGDVELTNVGRTSCALRGTFRLQIVRVGGAALPVRQAASQGGQRAALLLPPGRANSALVTLFWSNWCGRRPGLLRLRMVLPGKSGVLVVPFNGPPDYAAVPACVSKDLPSTVALISTLQQR